jgi:hypothetical protein
MHTQIRMRIMIGVLTLVQKGKTPLQVAEEYGHASIATLIRNAPKQREEEKARSAAAAAAAAAAAEAKRKEADNAAAKVASASSLYSPLSPSPPVDDY